MTPHPKRKHSKGRRDRRRSQDALIRRLPHRLLQLRFDAHAAHRLSKVRLLQWPRSYSGQKRKESSRVTINES